MLRLIWVNSIQPHETNKLTFIYCSDMSKAKKFKPKLLKIISKFSNSFNLPFSKCYISVTIPQLKILTQIKCGLHYNVTRLTKAM